MNIPLPHDQRQRRMQYLELLLTVFLVVSVLLVGRTRQWLPMIIAAYVVLTLLLYSWTYRNMDEFRRLRWLKSWAAAAHAGLATIIATYLWAALHTPAQAAAPGLTLPLEYIYLPVGVMALTQLGVTAYLYRRDTRG